MKMKMTDIRNLDDKDLLMKIDELKKRYARLKITHQVSPLENPMEIRELRRTIARLLTEKTARGLK